MTQRDRGAPADRGSQDQGNDPGLRGQAAYNPIPGAPNPTYPAPTSRTPTSPGPASPTLAASWTPRLPPTQFLAQVGLRPDYARWSRRVAASLIDSAIGWVGLVVFFVGYLRLILTFVRVSLPDSTPTDLGLRGPVTTVVVGLVVLLVDVGWNIYNRWFLAGRTGQSVGKRAMKIWLVGRETNRPIGPLNAFVRDLLHVVDSQYYIGYLWPLWDAERQTFADKIVSSVVVTSEVAPLEPAPKP